MGKWHLQVYQEKEKADSPQGQGFDVNIGGHSQGQPASYFYPYQAKASKVKIL